MLAWTNWHVEFVVKKCDQWDIYIFIITLKVIELGLVIINIMSSFMEMNNTDVIVGHAF